MFIFLKNTKRNFSILDSFENYLKGNISTEILKMNNKKILIRLIILTVIFLIPISFLISENNSNEFEIRANYIFASSIFLTLSLCYYLYFSVNNYIKNNLSLSTSHQITEYDKSKKNLETIKNVNKIGKIQIFENVKKYFKKIKLINLKTFEKLSSDEIIIISIIIGCVFFLICGNLFGETQYFNSRGVRVSSDEYGQSKIDFNYITAIIGFIITAGLSYMYLNRKCNKTNNIIDNLNLKSKIKDNWYSIIVIIAFIIMLLNYIELKNENANLKSQTIKKIKRVY